MLTIRKISQLQMSFTILHNVNLIPVFFCSVLCGTTGSWCIAGLFFTSQKPVTTVLCSVCNVLCLCLTSLTCNSMSRRRREKDSFMKFVIVRVLWLFPLQTQRRLHFLLVLICLFGSGRLWNTNGAPALSCRSISQTDMSIWGIEDWRQCCKGRSCSCHSPTTTRSVKQSQGWLGWRDISV